MKSEPSDYDERGVSPDDRSSLPPVTEPENVVVVGNNHEAKSAREKRRLQLYGFDNSDVKWTGLATERSPKGFCVPNSYEQVMASSWADYRREPIVEEIKPFMKPMDRLNLRDAKQQISLLPTDAMEFTEEDQVMLPVGNLVRGLQFIANLTWSDISTAVSFLSRHLSRPSERTWKNCKQALRYLNTS